MYLILFEWIKRSYQHLVIAIFRSPVKVYFCKIYNITLDISDYMKMSGKESCSIVSQFGYNVLLPLTLACAKV